MKKTIILITVMLSLLLRAKAATIVVTNTNNAGTGSLRQAVIDAVNGDTIRFSSNLIASGSDSIVLTSEIAFNKELVFKGLYNVTDTLFISGNYTNRIFNANLSIGKSLTIDSLVLINGNTTGSGGAISLVDGDSLVVNNCIIRNNTASSGAGGGIYSYSNFSSSSVTVTNSIVSGNTASSFSSNSYGGGIFSYTPNLNSSSSVNVINSTVSGNTVSSFYNSSSSPNSSGGGIYSFSSNSFVTVINSTVSGNTVSSSNSFSNSNSYSRGGGIYSNSSNFSSVNVINSTVSGNTVSSNSFYSSSNGGGIYSHSSNSSTVMVTNSTVSGNITSSPNSYGRGIYSYSSNSSSTITCKGSIVWSASDNIYNNNSSTITSNGYNIFSDNPTGSISTDQTNITTGQLNLQSLAYNGGTTQTMLPGVGSVAIDMGDPTDMSNAQNGAIIGGRRDVGASESNVCTAIMVNNTDSICQGDTYNFRGQILNTSGTYKDTVINLSGCDSVFSLDLTVISSQTPTVNITVSPSNSIMAGTNVTFTASVTYGGTSPTYQWKLNGNNVGANSATYSTASLSNNDIVSCVITSNYTCLTNTTAISNDITVSVTQNNDEPCDAILLTVNNTCNYSTFDNTSATLTTSVPIPNCVFTAYRDLWFKVIVPASGELTIYTQSGGLTNAVLTLYYGSSCNGLVEFACIDDVGGNYMPSTTITGATPGEVLYIRVGGANSNDYGTFGICVFDINSTVNIEENKTFDYFIYPNPATDILNIELSDLLTNNLQIYLYNMEGRMMKVYPQTFKNKIQLNVESLAKGFYTLSISKGNEVITKSIVITR